MATVFNWLRITPLSKRVKAYGQTKKDFYESRIYLQNLEKLNHIFNRDLRGALRTDKEITFYGIKFGYSCKETSRKLGKPNYRVSENRILNDHQIFFYRLKIATVNCILQMHFLNDSFFLGVIEMRTGKIELKNRLFELIQRKYQIESPIGGELIADNLGNTIYVKEDVVPFVTYSSGDSSLRTQLVNATIPVNTKSDFQLTKSLLVDMT